MKFVWPVLLVISRALYVSYSLWCLAFPLALVCLGSAQYSDGWALHHHGSVLIAGISIALVAFTVLVISVVYARRTPGDPNPFQSAFMAWFGTLRWFWNTRPGDMAALGLPSGLLVENPKGYRTSGPDTREIMGRIQPGDILLRGYVGYLDGTTIRHSSRCTAKGFQPGWFTHVALYVGPLDEKDKVHVPGDFVDPTQGYFAQGPQMLIHSMAKGVHTEDVLTFCRCDYLAVLRIRPGLQCINRSPGKFGNKSAGLNNASHSDTMSKVVEDNMLEGQRFDRDLAIQTARLSALEKIGEKYDFDCSDTTHFFRFSCAELVYYCYRGIRTALDLKPQIHGLYPLGNLNKNWAILKRKTITPDDYYALIKQGTVECIWQDKVTKARHAATKSSH
jgi:hypothetical protein